MNAAEQPGTAELLRTVVGADPERKLLWSVVEQVFRILDSGDEGKIRHLQQGSFYLMANLRSLNSTGEAVAALAPVIQANREYLARNAGVLVDFASAPEMSRLLRSLFEESDPQGDRVELSATLRFALRDAAPLQDLFSLLSAIDGSPRGHQSWELLKSRWEAMTDSREYREIALGDVTDRLLRYLSSDPQSVEGRAVGDLRLYFSRRLRSENGISDILDLVSLLARNPDEFDRLSRTVARAIDRGEVSDLVHMAERALRNP